MTKPGTPKRSRLSEVARKVSAPTGIVSTGWPAVEATCRTKLGLTFDSWQQQSGRLALAKRADGKLAAMIDGVGMSVCRQAGKTHWLTGLVFGVSINRPGTLTVWSAHHARTHGETFLAMQAFTERQRVDPYIEQVFTGSGDEEIRFRNGSRILFGARDRGFGRGVPGVDIIVADEAQILTERAVDAMTATLNTSAFGLMFYIGTPPRPEDPSEAFTRMRDDAWAGTLEDGVWIEFGAESGSDPGSPATWAAANPSYPLRTPRESMLRLKKKLSAESFLREGLGIWVDPVAAREYVLDLDAWAEQIDQKPTPVGARAIAVSRTQNLEWLSVAAATRTAGGRIHVEVGFHGRSSDAALRLLLSLVERWDPCALVIDSADTAMTLQATLVDAGIEPDVTTASEYLLACSNFVDFTTARRLSWTGDPLLQAAVEAAEWRKLLGGLVWQDRTVMDVSALKAASLAVYGLVTFEARAERKGATTPKFTPTSEKRDEIDLMTAGF